MVQLKKKVTLKTKIADSDVKQDIQPKNTRRNLLIKQEVVTSVTFGSFGV